MAFAWRCQRFALSAEQPRETETLRVAVYDVPPYGYVDTDGSISGVSVDLWRRVAEQMEWPFKLIPVSDMESILSGLEQGRFDAAIGAITITPERAARVDFSYPAHRSGVAIALAQGNRAAFRAHVLWDGRHRAEPIDLVILTMLVLIGIAMWIVERRARSAAPGAGVRGRHVARRPLLGRRDDDDRRLRRQDAENHERPHRRDLMDAQAASCWFRCCRRVWCRD